MVSESSWSSDACFYSWIFSLPFSTMNHTHTHVLSLPNHRTSFTYVHAKRKESVSQPVSQFSHSVMSNSLWPHGLQHARLTCSSPTPRVYSNSCPLGWWCHPTISSSVIPFSPDLQYFPASGSFPMSQFFTSGGQSIGVSASASVLPTNIQD